MFHDNRVQCQFETGTGRIRYEFDSDMGDNSAEKRANCLRFMFGAEVSLALPGANGTHATFSVTVEEDAVEAFTAWLSFAGYDLSTEE